ncbi:MAG: hypothetical protein H7A46_18425 [Verrucomicrobiales bacterium]|nr:hypothetical protein [Verrucomicrobiales bacterium]
MTLQVDIPDSLLRQATELAARQKVTVDQLVSTALSAQVSAAALRPSIAERGRRVDWRKVDDILDRVPARPPEPGDEQPPPPDPVADTPA